MHISEISKLHYQWVDEMGWHNKTILESLALIASEFGESAAECITFQPKEEFGEELADIFLRIADLSYENNIDLEFLVSQHDLVWQTETNLERLAETMIDFGHLVNSVRKKDLDDQFSFNLSKVALRIIDLAKLNGINFEEKINAKIKLNKERGNRGRII